MTPEQRIWAEVEEILEEHRDCCAGKDEHMAHVFESCDHWEPRWCNGCRVELPCPTRRLALMIKAALGEYGFFAGRYAMLEAVAALLGEEA